MIDRVRMRSSQLIIAACVPIAAIGIAMARGKKAQEVPVPPPEAPAPAPAVEATPAPPLFPDGLPVALTALPAGLASLSAQGCNACHYTAHDTWYASAHANAGNSATYRAAIRASGASTACSQCHLPIAAQHDQLAAGYIDGDLARPRLQPNPSFDATLSGEGVTCAACHVRGDTILGTRASALAPHPVTVSAELSDSAMCATCHQLTWPGADKPYYDTFGEWKASAYATAGVSCQACHMAPVAGTAVLGEPGVAPSHALDADVRRAVSALVRFDRAVVQRGQSFAISLVLQNTGAGHSFPTGNPATVARVDVVLLDSAGKELAPAFSTTLARAVDAAPPWRTIADNRLASGAQMSLAHSFAANVKGAPGSGALEVRIVKNGVTTLLRRVSLEIL